MENLKNVRRFLHNSFCFAGILLLPFLLLQPINNNVAIIDNGIIQDPDTIPPVANCQTGLIILSLPATGCITIHAKDLDRGSFDNVTPAEKLKFYFSGNSKNDSLHICCYDFVIEGAQDELFVEVFMFVEDEAGNTDFCKLILIIQDDQNICPGEDPNYIIAGKIHTGTGEDVIAKVTVTQPNGFNIERESSNFKFSFFVKGKYTLCIEKPENHLNGVSSADRIKINRHILEVKPFTSPYQYLASDVNASKTTTASDVTEIWKLVLGVKDQFSKVPNWIFVPKEITFSPGVVPDVKQFIPSCRIIEINDGPIPEYNYIGIKMGDVDGNARGE